MNKTYAERIVEQLINESLIGNKSQEIYLYAIKQVIFIVVNFLITLCLAFVLNKKVELLIFILEFAILRSFSGGYHTRSNCMYIVFFNDTDSRYFIYRHSNH